MAFLTEDKLVIVGAGGAIGSTMVQTALTMQLTPNVCLYDVYAPGMEGVMEEMFHCGYDGVNLTATTDVAEAFKDAKYIISSGGAPRKAGMTRELQNRRGRGKEHQTVLPRRETRGGHLQPR